MAGFAELGSEETAARNVSVSPSDRAPSPRAASPSRSEIMWSRLVPYTLLHLSCFFVLWVGWSPVAVWTAVFLYAIRMFAITGFYHRYFSHRTFRTSRPMQFLFGVLGASAAQKGPLWWAAHHRYHHQHADLEHDLHSPSRHGFLWSHVGWIWARSNYDTELHSVRDLSRYPELRWLDRNALWVPVGLAVSLYGVGALLAQLAPALGTSGGQMVVWGFCISTVVLYHATYTINSLAHSWGSRRYDTRDDSRNNWFLALITLGEGWHNNHHRYPVATRQGFFWWEIDLTYYGLWVLSKLGIVWGLRPVPARIRNEEQRSGGLQERAPRATRGPSPSSFAGQSTASRNAARRNPARRTSARRIATRRTSRTSA